MFDEFSVEVFIIKIKIKGYIENKQTKSKELIDTYGIKNKNNINYLHNDTLYKIKLLDNKLSLIRENDNVINTFHFEKDKITKSEYYIKEYSSSIYVSLTTKNIIINENNITIKYIINDTNEEYTFMIEMSEKK